MSGTHFRVYTLCDSRLKVLCLQGLRFMGSWSFFKHIFSGRFGVARILLKCLDSQSPCWVNGFCLKMPAVTLQLWSLKYRA